MTTYDKGDSIRASADFSDLDDVPTDPTTVTLQVESPAGTVVDYTYGAGDITKDGTGSYHKNLSLNVSGDWHFRWFGTGAVEQSRLSTISVRRSRF